jgi:phage baseplate assembly protein V
MNKSRNRNLADAASIFASVSSARIGIVTSYDPKAYAVKVKVMPEEIETGWLKIMALQVGPGAGFGIYAAPDIGVQAVIIHQEGDRNNGICIGFLNDDEEDLPPPDPGVPAGEIHFLHKSGSLLKFKKDGDVLLTTHRDLIATVTRDMTAHVTRDLAVTVDGKTDLTSAGQLVVHCDDINLGGTGGKRVALHQDPVSGGQVQASSTKVKAL